ncbi:hypothetical protein [Halogeometricum borinquense]|uniref:hypothetical protein n=1 Tax=Halogeometricum borinquense TaxID=60847 RepID=UPI001EF8D8F6|nr:hypothetical protein [Halogeometricum borinquense]
MLHINGVTWDIYGEDTKITYEHKYDQDKTYFKIEDDDNSFEMTYDAWWKEVPHLKPSEWLTFEEQDNEIEDFFGYIKYLSINEEDKNNWVESWSEALQG